jgi:hypothetical protein
MFRSFLIPVSFYAGIGVDDRKAFTDEAEILDVVYIQLSDAGSEF